MKSLRNGSYLVSFFRQAAGRGARATGGWVLRSDAQSPRPAFCLHRSFCRGVSPYPSQHFNILFNSDKTYLCLISFFQKVDKYLYDCELSRYHDGGLGSFEIRKGSFEMCVQG